MKDILLELIERDCPFCNKVHVLEKRLAHTRSLIKGEAVEHEEIYFLCPITKDTENAFTPAGLFDENTLSAKNAYRKKHGLLPLDEIND